MGKKMINKKSKLNPFTWFLFAIVIPIIVAITLTIIIMTVAGVNVVDWAKSTGSNVPVLSSFILTDEEKADQKVIEDAEEKIINQKSEIDALNQTINNLETTIDQLEQNILKLENKNQSDANRKEDNDNADQEISTIKKMSASFRKMNSKQAALIFQDLEEDVAIRMLQELSNDVRGGILEAMDPKKAAELTEKYIDSNK